MANLLEVVELGVWLGGRWVLEGVSLSVGEGELVALIGPNGAGKTTLLRVALGLIPYQRGEVRVLGKLPAKLTPADRAQIGYVPQALQFDRTMPLLVSELLQAMLGEHFSRRAALQHVLEAVDAQHLLDREVRALSGGELQRVVVAAALALEPRLLLLDEPATGIDVGVRRQFYDLIEEQRTHRGVGALVVSHDLSIVSRYATRVVCIHHRLLCTGTPQEVLQMPIMEELYGHPVSVYQHAASNE
ncbi:MAG: metal ABC transporter ATP-binding protein [Armatimonadota bacterium]